MADQNQIVFPSRVDTPSDWVVELHCVRFCHLLYRNSLQGLGICSRPSDGAVIFMLELPNRED